MSPEADRPGADRVEGFCRSHHDDAAATDSAGAPWAGRRFEPNPFSGDDGSADEALADALRRFHAGGVSPVAVIEAYRGARLLIPLVAEKGDEGIGVHGLPVDKTQELSIVTVAAPDGRRVLPVFSSVATMTAWDPAARPVPADGRRTATAAVQDQTDLIVLDPGSATEFVIRRPAVWAIAQDTAWEPSHLSPDVFAGFQESIGGELAVLDLALADADPRALGRGPELLVEVELMPGLDRAELDVVLQRLARRWAADDRIAVLVDSLTVRLRRART